MKKLHCIFLLTLCTLSLHARSEHYTCVSFEYPPLIHKGIDGKAEGEAVDIVNSVFKKMGHTISIELYPWGRALLTIQHGDRDCIFTVYHSNERDQFLDYSKETLVSQIIYFYVRKDSNISFNGDVGALNGVRIGTASHVNYGPKFESMRRKLDIDEAPTIELNFMKLALGRVDLVPSNFYTASATLSQNDLARFADRLARLPIPTEEVPSFIGFSKSKKLTELRDRFDEELRKFSASDEYKNIIDKYRLPSLP
ncbi:MAG TPA: transporter substrate-binding domain-containing protein [Burkholderiaceae bacterium]|nr:transporter substrate-binding domain-containing protein [Burkholderiaceae bacterium]